MKLYACGYNLNGQISNSNTFNGKASWTLIADWDPCKDSCDESKESLVAFGFSYIVHCSGNNLKLRGFDSPVVEEILIPHPPNIEKTLIINVSSYKNNVIVIQSNGNVWKLNLKIYRTSNTEIKSMISSRGEDIDEIEQPVNPKPVKEIPKEIAKASDHESKINCIDLLPDGTKYKDSLGDKTPNFIKRLKSEILKDNDNSSKISQIRNIEPFPKKFKSKNNVETSLENSKEEENRTSQSDLKPVEGLTLIKHLFGCELDLSSDDGSDCESGTKQNEEASCSLTHEDKLIHKSKRRHTSQGRKRKMNQLKTSTCSDNIQLLLSERGHVFNIPGRLDYFTSHVVTDIACGFDHCLALTEEGIVYSWGNGSRGQLGYQSASPVEEPQEIAALSGLGVVQIAAGGWHSAARTRDGFLYAWGWNNAGQVGVRGKLDLVVYEPQPISWAEDLDSRDIKVIDVACGSRHTIAVCDDNSVWGCGWNEYNQICLGCEVSKVEVMTRVSLAELPAGSRVHAVYAGHWNSALVLS